MWDLATIVRLNEEAHRKAVAESEGRFERLRDKLSHRYPNATPIRKNGIILAVNLFGDDEWTRVYFDLDFFHSETC